MAPPVTLYRFRIDLSDIDRGLYDTLDFRVALHPSEAVVYLLTRVLAFCLNQQDGLAFSKGGLSDPDEPVLAIVSPNGGYSLWIEIGNPAAKRLHKASKASKSVKVYTYKNASALTTDLAGENIHRREDIEVYSFPPKFLEKLGASLERDNEWSVIVQQGALTVTTSAGTEETEITRHVL